MREAPGRPAETGPAMRVDQRSGAPRDDEWTMGRAQVTTASKTSCGSIRDWFGRLPGRIIRLAPPVALLAFAAGGAEAAQPRPWEMGLQPAATEVMGTIRWFESFTLVIITLVVLLVMALLLAVIVKFNARANPTPSRTSHNTMIEVIWTVAPIIILVVIAIPSFRLLYKELDLPPADMTVKVTGYQWYWGYEYPDEKYAGISFDSYMLNDEDREKRMAEDKLTSAEVPRLLAVDNSVVVPVGKTVRVQVTAADVIHSFALPSFGVKVDAIPGRLNETWFKADAPGVYYGQCSELCGTNHAFMPIAIRAVPEDQFEKWAEAAKSDVGEANKLLAGLIEADRAARSQVAAAQ
jgi:cytochrome c oxidase subunit 2